MTSGNASTRKLRNLTEAAVRAPALFGDWLNARLGSFGQDTSAGARSFAFSLHRVAPMPACLAPLTWPAVPYDPAAPSRLDEDAVRYVREPRPGLTYFALVLGELTVEQAAGHLAEHIPMDDETARQEAVLFAANPGLGSSYQLGTARRP